MRQDPRLPDGWTQQMIDRHYGLDTPEVDYEYEVDEIIRDEKAGLIEVSVYYSWTCWEDDERMGGVSPDETYGLDSWFKLRFEDWNEKTDKEIEDYVLNELVE